MSDYLAPPAITALLQVGAGSRFGFDLLPFSEGIQRDFWAFALVCGVAGSFVAMQQFGSAARDFGMWWYAGTVGLLLLTLAPPIAARYGLTLRLETTELTALSVVTYVVMGAVLGVLVGGTVSAIRKMRLSLNRA